MNAPRGSLRSFLSSARSNLHSAIVNQQRVTLVIGNESADLDSITSAILLAYLRSNSGPSPINNPSVNKHTPPSQYPPLYIPLLNIPRAEVQIRPELLALLPHANIEPSHLITLDDLSAEPPAGINPDGKETLQPQHTRLVLTDHNRLAGPLAQRGFNDCVVGCIDHHVDEHTVPQETGNEPRIIEKAGSCTSLVLNYCRSAWDSLSGSASEAGRATASQSDAVVGVDDAAVRRTWDGQLARFALASVLIDTHALRDESKTEDVDRRAVDYLEAKILLAPGSAAASWDRESFYAEIDAAKKDISGLTVDQILAKDYKQWDVGGTQLGIGSVVQSLTWLIAHAGGDTKFRDALHKFVAERKLGYLSVLTKSTSQSGDFERELLLWAVDGEGSASVERFGGQAQDELKLEPWKEQDGLQGSQDGSGLLKVWWQRDVEQSRKQVAPLMRKILPNT